MQINWYRLIYDIVYIAVLLAVKDLEARARRWTSADSVHICYQELCILIKVKSCNALSSMLLACISNLLKSVLRYKFSIYVSCHPGTLHVAYMNKDVRICGYFSKPKGVRQQRTMENSGLRHYS